jgi:hypothetical protein
MTNRAINKRAGGFGARPPGVRQRRVDGFLRSSRSIGKEAIRVWRAGRPSAIAQRGTNGATEDALLLTVVVRARASASSTFVRNAFFAAPVALPSAPRLPVKASIVRSSPATTPASSPARRSFPTAADTWRERLVALRRSLLRRQKSPQRSIWQRRCMTHCFPRSAFRAVSLRNGCPAMRPHAPRQPRPRGSAST